MTWKADTYYSLSIFAYDSVIRNSESIVVKTAKMSDKKQISVTVMFKQ